MFSKITRSKVKPSDSNVDSGAAKIEAFQMVPIFYREMLLDWPPGVAKMRLRQSLSVGGYDVRGFIVLLGCVSTSAWLMATPEKTCHLNRKCVCVCVPTSVWVRVAWGTKIEGAREGVEDTHTHMCAECVWVRVCVARERKRSLIQMLRSHHRETYIPPRNFHSLSLSHFFILLLRVRFFWEKWLGA